MARQVIREALELMKRSEKTSLAAYQGKADKPGVMTVGTGHVIRKGEEWMLKGVTEAQADDIFAKDVAEHSKWIQVDLGIGVTVDDYEFGSLASLCFNEGPRALQKAESVVIPLRAGNPNGIINLYKHSNSNGQYRDGLFYRRLTEIALALTHKLVDKPDNCVQARKLIADLKLPQEVTDFFHKKHRRDLCVTCKHSSPPWA